MTGPMVNELIDRDKVLEQRRHMMPLMESSARQEYVSDIEAYVYDAEQKISHLTGRRNIRRLKRLAKKWRSLLSEIEQEAARVSIITPDPRIDPEVTTLAPRMPVPTKFGQRLNEWAARLRYRLQYLTVENRIDPSFSQPTTSSDPEIARMIDSMYP